MCLHNCLMGVKTKNLNSITWEKMAAPGAQPVVQLHIYSQDNFNELWYNLLPLLSLTHTQTHSYIHIDIYFILLKNEEVVILKLEDELKSRYYTLTLTKMKMKRLSEGKLNKCQKCIFTQSFSLTEWKWMTVHSLKESSDRHRRWNEI